MTRRSGSVSMIALLVGFLLVVGGIVFFRSRIPPPRTEAGPEIAVPSETPTPTPEPTAAPTPPPTPSPAPTLSPVPTARPTSPPVSGPPGSGLSRITVATAKGNFSATVLSLDLATTRVVTDTASDSDCPTDCPVLSLRDFVTRNNGFAGVNGTYFCPSTYPECASKTNSFDFPVYNTRLNRWINGGNLGWGGRSLFFTRGDGSSEYQQDSTAYPGSPQSAIINYPGLVHGGNIQIDDNQSGLSDKQKVKGTKVGIGLRDSRNVMVVIAQNVTMLEFAHVFKSLGATGALNLDSGGSTALFYNSSYVYGPGRNLPNSVIFVRK